MTYLESQLERVTTSCLVRRPPRDRRGAPPSRLLTRGAVNNDFVPSPPACATSRGLRGLPSGAPARPGAHRPTNPPAPPPAQMVESYEARLQDMREQMKELEARLEGAEREGRAVKQSEDERDGMQRTAYQNLADRVQGVEADLKSHPFLVLPRGVDREKHALDLRVLDAKFRTWAQQQEARFAEAATAMEKRVVDRMEVVTREMAAARAEVDRHIGVAREDVVSRMGAFAQEVRDGVESMRGLAREAVGDALAAHLADVRSVESRLAGRMDALAGRAATREEIRRTLEALELMAAANDGPGGMGEEARRSFRDAVAQAKAAVSAPRPATSGRPSQPYGGVSPSPSRGPAGAGRSGSTSRGPGPRGASPPAPATPRSGTRSTRSSLDAASALDSAVARAVRDVDRVLRGAADVERSFHDAAASISGPASSSRGGAGSQARSHGPATPPRGGRGSVPASPLKSATPAAAPASPRLATSERASSRRSARAAGAGGASAVAHWEAAARREIETVRSKVGEIHSSFGAVRGALRGMHSSLAAEGSARSGEDRGQAHREAAERRAREHAEALARQEAAVAEALAKIDALHVQLMLAGVQDKGVARALELLAGQVQGRAGMFDAEAVSRQLTQLLREVASGAEATATLTAALERLARRVEDMADTRGRRPFVVPTSAEYTERVKKEYYDEEERAYRSRPVSGASSLLSSPARGAGEGAGEGAGGEREGRTPAQARRELFESDPVEHYYLRLSGEGDSLPGRFSKSPLRGGAGADAGAPRDSEMWGRAVQRRERLQLLYDQLAKLG